MRMLLSLSYKKLLFLLLLCGLSIQLDLLKQEHKNLDYEKQQHFEIKQKNIINRASGNSCVINLSYRLPGVVVWAPNLDIQSTSSDCECEYYCYTIKPISIGWTRNEQSGDCYCHNLPFGPGAISATVSSSWSSGFYSNATITQCGNVVIFGQQINYTPQTMWANIKTYESCATTCYNGGYPVVSYNDNIGICNCGYQSTFQTSAMVTNSQYWTVFNFGLGS